LNIGIIITRIGGVDGVALETEKWIKVFERMGHNLKVLSGELERPFPNVTVLEELGLYHPFCTTEQEGAFFQSDMSEKSLMELLKEHSAFLQKRIQEWMLSNSIDCLVSQNISALPCHLSAGVALAQAAIETGVYTVLHLHDFYWERGERYTSPYLGVKRLLQEYFPPKGEIFKHVVINTYNKERLERDFAAESVVVPNVMDFDVNFGQRDDYNEDFPSEMGFSRDDLVLSQVTRIVRRKGIETAVELVKRLQDKRVRLLITGLATDDPGCVYYNELLRMVEEAGVADGVLFVGERVGHARTRVNGKKIYSLSDVYAHTRACTYFSTYEGFGNAFVEACAARVPVFVNDYEPVYWPDIGSKGFKTIMTKNNVLKDCHVEAAREILADKAYAREIADHNYNLAKKHFSYDVLEESLREILREI